LGKWKPAKNQRPFPQVALGTGEVAATPARGDPSFTSRPLFTGLKHGILALIDDVVRKNHLVLFVPAAVVALFSLVQAAGADPHVAFASTNFDFGVVKSGDLVKHSFLFTNTGTATLTITNVKPGCGCTTAGDWDREVQPSQTGRIPLQFNSAGFSGPVAKTAEVFCNDPAQSNIILQLTGTVWKPIDITPAVVVFQPSEEDLARETKSVRIASHLDEPLTLSHVECTHRSFRAELKAIKPGKEFELEVTALPPFKSRYLAGSITAKTSSAQAPLLVVAVSLVVQPVLAVIPEQVLISAGPLASQLTSFVTIINNSKRELTFGDVRVNTPGVEARIRNPDAAVSPTSMIVQPGKQITLEIGFPAGFQIPPEQSLSVCVSTTHPKFPVLRIPIANMSK
jgi:hypothetical protein